MAYYNSLGYHGTAIIKSLEQTVFPVTVMFSTKWYLSSTSQWHITLVHINKSYYLKSNHYMQRPGIKKKKKSWSQMMFDTKLKKSNLWLDQIFLKSIDISNQFKKFWVHIIRFDRYDSKKLFIQKYSW